MTDHDLFEIAAKLHNVRPDQLRLKKRYLDAVVIELMDGSKFTYFVTDLESLAEGNLPPALAPEVEPSTPQKMVGQAKPSHTRKR